MPSSLTCEPSFPVRDPMTAPCCDAPMSIPKQGHIGYPCGTTESAQLVHMSVHRKYPMWPCLSGASAGPIKDQNSHRQRISDDPLSVPEEAHRSRWPIHVPRLFPNKDCSGSSRSLRGGPTHEVSRRCTHHASAEGLKKSPQRTPVGRQSSSRRRQRYRSCPISGRCRHCFRVHKTTDESVAGRQRNH